MGASIHAYDFESEPQGWTFARRPGIGAFMAVWPEAIWSEWLEQVGLACPCPMAGTRSGSAPRTCPIRLPGFPTGHHEYAYSGVVERGAYLPPDYNAVYVRMAGYFYLSPRLGHLRPPGLDDLSRT